MKKNRFEMRLSDEGQRNLSLLMKKTGLKGAPVIEMLLRQECERRKPMPRSSRMVFSGMAEDSTALPPPDASGHYEESCVDSECKWHGTFDPSEVREERAAKKAARAERKQKTQRAVKASLPARAVLRQNAPVKNPVEIPGRCEHGEPRFMCKRTHKK